MLNLFNINAFAEGGGRAAGKVGETQGQYYRRVGQTLLGGTVTKGKNKGKRLKKISAKRNTGQARI